MGSSRSPDDVQSRQKFVDSIQKELHERFPQSAESNIFRLMRMQYFRLYLVTSGFRALKGKKVLDIACGARQVDSEYHDRRSQLSEPWFSRFAAAAGAEVTGIDRRRSDPAENFTHDVGDVTKAETLQKYADASFDIVNTAGFLVGPGREEADASGVLSTTPELLHQYTDKELQLLDTAISQQVLRMLKEDGYYLYNESVYQKKNNTFHRVSLSTLTAEQGIPVLPSDKT